jgi:chemotaxis protein CheD
LFHALLPIMADYTKNGRKANELPWRYVDASIEAMVNKFKDMGSPPDKLQIKIFGGAAVLIPSQKRREPKTVGMQNVKAALDTLQRLGLRPVASDVGGKRGRKIIYFTHTGEVLLKRLRGQG